MKSGLVCNILELVYAVLMRLGHNESGLCSYRERALVIMRGLEGSKIMSVHVLTRLGLSLPLDVP